MLNLCTLLFKFLISFKIKELLDDKVFLEKILKDGYEKANEIASKKIKKIQEIVGF